jgi:shikimate 5-dehydrogenase
LLPYRLHGAHIAFDLIYNPAEQFLKKAKDEGAKIKNSYDMLVFKQKKHGKSGINKLHYTTGKSHQIFTKVNI